MQKDYCSEMGEREILNEKKENFPLFEVTIYGSRLESLKISKRLTCSIKHLPLRLKVHYERDTLSAIAAGVGEDPTVKLGDKFIIKGLIPAEEITDIFSKLMGVRINAVKLSPKP
jgi:hypothetical protein